MMEPYGEKKRTTVCFLFLFFWLDELDVKTKQKKKQLKKQIEQIFMCLPEEFKVDIGETIMHYRGNSSLAYSTQIEKWNNIWPWRVRCQ